MHGFTPSSLLLLLVAGAGLSSAAPIGLVLPEAAAVSVLPNGAQVQAAASSSATAALPASSAVAPAPVSATASASASSATPASSVAPASSAVASSAKPSASASASAPPATPSLCPGVVEWTGAVYLDNDDSSVDTRMTMKTRCPPGAKSIKLTVVDTATCAPLTSTTRNLGFKTLEANVYDGDLKTLSEGRSDDGKAITLSCGNTDSISLVAIFHGPKRVMSDALTFTAPQVEAV